MHKLIPFHKTRRSQSPPGARPHAGTSSQGSGQRPIRCPFHTTAASPCLALPCLAMPCHATQCLAVPRSVWMLPHPSRQRHALAVGYENCCLEFCCGLVSEPMLPPSRLSAPLLGPPSPRGLSSHHPISCRRVLPAPKGLRLPSSYLLGLPPSGSSFQRAVAAPLAFPVRREEIIANSLTMSQYEFAYSIITR